jgi:hypothetical protein
MSSNDNTAFVVSNGFLVVDSAPTRAVVRDSPGPGWTEWAPLPTADRRSRRRDDDDDEGEERRAWGRRAANDDYDDDRPRRRGRRRKRRDGDIWHPDPKEMRTHDDATLTEPTARGEEMKGLAAQQERNRMFWQGGVPHQRVADAHLAPRAGDASLLRTDRGKQSPAQESESIRAEQRRLNDFWNAQARARRE